MLIRRRVNLEVILNEVADFAKLISVEKFSGVYKNGYSHNTHTRKNENLPER